MRSNDWISIGGEELISKRTTHPVPIPPGGVLNDYVPFYFTPFSVMSMKISSGQGVKQRSKEEILIFVSSIHHRHAMKLPFVFTSMHACSKLAEFAFYSDVRDLDKIDWPLLQARDFKREDNEDPRKLDCYQAEALVHRHLPLQGLRGIVCYTDARRIAIERKIKDRGLTLPIHTSRKWYL